MLKTFKYRIYPTKSQISKMKQILTECRWLYNHFLEQRKNKWEQEQESLSLFKQHSTLKQLKQDMPSLNKVHSQVLQNVGVRLDLAFQAFFRRVKAGEKPGYPRFKGFNRYRSFTYPQSGFKVNETHISLSKIGNVKIVLHRPIEGKLRTCTVSFRETDKWYICFSCECEPKRLPIVDTKVGIDVGIKTFATFSTGDEIPNPQFFRKDENELAKAQRKLSKELKGTKQYREKRKVVARVHERIAFRRDNFTHQESRKIINRFGIIAVEDLNINRMNHNHCLAKSIMDAAWNEFFNKLSVKAEEAGRKFVKVNPAYTSQTCSSCGHRQKMPLEKRIFQCPCCQLEIDRDLNASINILGLGLQAIGVIQEAPAFMRGE